MQKQTLFNVFRCVLLDSHVTHGFTYEKGGEKPATGGEAKKPEAREISYAEDLAACERAFRKTVALTTEAAAKPLEKGSITKSIADAAAALDKAKDDPRFEGFVKAYKAFLDTGISGFEPKYAENIIALLENPNRDTVTNAIADAWELRAKSSDPNLKLYDDLMRALNKLSRQTSRPDKKKTTFGEAFKKSVPALKAAAIGMGGPIIGSALGVGVAAAEALGGRKETVEKAVDYSSLAQKTIDWILASGGKVNLRAFEETFKVGRYGSYGEGDPMDHALENVIKNDKITDKAVARDIYEKVKFQQQRLRKLGAKIKADGVFGALTYKAIMQYDDNMKKDLENDQTAAKPSEPQSDDERVEVPAPPIETAPIAQEETTTVPEGDVQPIERLPEFQGDNFYELKDDISGLGKKGDVVYMRSIDKERGTITVENAERQKQTIALNKVSKIESGGYVGKAEDLESVQRFMETQIRAVAAKNSRLKQFDLRIDEKDIYVVKTTGEPISVYPNSQSESGRSISYMGTDGKLGYLINDFEGNVGPNTWKAAVRPANAEDIARFRNAYLAAMQ